MCRSGRCLVPEETPADRRSSLCGSLLSGTPHPELLPLWSPQTCSSVCSAKGTTWVLPPRDVDWSSPKAAGWGDQGAVLVCFLLRITGLPCLISGTLKTVISYALSFVSGFSRQGKSIPCHSILVGSRRCPFTLSVRFFKDFIYFFFRGEGGKREGEKHRREKY